MKKLFVVSVCLIALLLGVGLKHYLKSDFTVLSGTSHTWSNSQGKWTVVNYFAEWCAPCLRELPELNTFYGNYNNSIRLFAISYDQVSEAELLNLQKKFDIQFPIISFLENVPWQQAPTSLPTTFILDPNGEVQSQLKGEQSAEKLKLHIAQLQGF